MNPYFSLWGYAHSLWYATAKTGDKMDQASTALFLSMALSRLAFAGAEVPDEVDTDAPLFAYDLWVDETGEI